MTNILANHTITLVNDHSHNKEAVERIKCQILDLRQRFRRRAPRNTWTPTEWAEIQTQTQIHSFIPSSQPCFPSSLPSFLSFPAATALGYAIPDGMKRERGLEREQDIPDKMPLCKSRMHGESTRWSAVTVWETRAWTRKKKNGESYPHILAPRNLLNQSGQPKISCGHSIGQPPIGCLLSE